MLLTCTHPRCRNRQVQAFYDVIQWFRPAFVLMENVMDIFHKQDGMYVKFAVGRLLSMRYQTRVGCIAAADHGAPQGRWRCGGCVSSKPVHPPAAHRLEIRSPCCCRAFLWGALAGQEQLPPFPEPSHSAAWQVGVPEIARASLVGFTSREAREAAFPMVSG
jgi:DNA (cytosine-5)-methyltransferase 1